MASIYCPPFGRGVTSDPAEGLFVWPQLGAPRGGRIVGCSYRLGSLRRSGCSQQNPRPLSDLDRHGRHDLVPILVDHDNSRSQNRSSGDASFCCCSVASQYSCLRVLVLGLDAGGPREREMRGVHADGAFLFPQMTLDRDAKRDMGEDQWSPGFIDYLFLAFNVSTAFSPSDSPILSRWAKTLVMIQALISFTTVALLAARAINIL